MSVSLEHILYLNNSALKYFLPGYFLEFPLYFELQIELFFRSLALTLSSFFVIFVHF